MELFGEKLRQLRKAKKLPLRKVAAYLDIDASILSKIERGERQASKTQVEKAAQFFEVNRDKLLAEFYGDKIAQLIYTEPSCAEILKVAESRVAYLRTKAVS